MNKNTQTLEELCESLPPKYYELPDGRDVISHMQKMFKPEEYKGFLKGNVLKYLMRFENKNGVEDLKKAKKYIDMLMKYEAECVK